MTTKRNIDDRLSNIEEDAENDEDGVTDVGLGVTADFVTYEHDGEGDVGALFDVHEVDE